MRKMLVLCLLFMLIPVLCMAGMRGAGYGSSAPKGKIVPSWAQEDGGMVEDYALLERELCKLVEGHFLRCLKFTWEATNILLVLNGTPEQELLDVLKVKAAELCRGKVVLYTKQEGGATQKMEVDCTKK